MDFEKDLTIDQDQLDREWLRQPVLYMQYAEELAEAQKKRDKAKDDLEIVKAELDSEIRKKKIDQGVKFTEAIIQSEILQSSAYQKHSSDLQKYTAEVNLIGAAVKAFEHRKKALENLVQLWLAEYFSSPVERGHNIREKAVEKTREKQMARMRRNKE